MSNFGLPGGVLEKMRLLGPFEVMRAWRDFEGATKAKYGKVDQAVRVLCLNDLYYLLVRVCRMEHMLPCKGMVGFVDNQFAFERCREVERDRDGYLDLWSREHFKDLADDTPMLTANRGWTTHGELVVGDQVFAPNGKPVSVIALSDRYTTSDCWRVKFTDGEIVAGAGHLWGLRHKVRRRVSGSDVRYIEWCHEVVSTEVLAGMRGRRDVGVADPLEMPVAQLRIDPYVFGAWLGDGTSSNATLTCAYADSGVLERIRAKGVAVQERKSTNENTGLFTLDVGIRGKRGTGMTAVLRQMGVLNNKHIPSEYLGASIYQRMELLRGLMDTDGTCNDRGTATFSNINERLTRQVYELAAGLGLRPRFGGHVMTVNDAPYQVWRVAFQAHKDRNPFALKRKADRAIGHMLHRQTRLVKSIERIQSVPTRCIQVDGGMYVAGRELVPTHNSTVITFGLTIQDILRDPETTIGIFSHTRPIAKAFLRQIMRELETNVVLHACFPDVLWGVDVKQAPKWALDIETPVMTVDGWKKHGDLLPGDRIFGSRGQVITVTGNSGPMDGVACRSVKFDDCTLIASADHLWPVQCKTRAGIKWDGAKLRILKTDQLRRAKTMRMLSTPVLQLPRRKSRLPVDPYILGLWLGDGTAGTNIISMHLDDEQEVLEQLVGCGMETYIHRRKPTDNFSMYGVKGLKEKLDSLGCLRRKHIPQQYLLRGSEDRLALLQGLMDSDGTCKKQGQARTGGMCTFSNTNIELANGALYLAASLGLRPSIFSFLPKSKGGLMAHHVYFIGLKSMPPFRLARKLSNCKDKRIKDGRYVRSIEKIEPVTVNCIKVDAQDSLYLAGERMVPTHNSEDDGIIVRRKSNPKEATVEAWGLVDGQPTSKHFRVLMYDDSVVQGSVSTPEMIDKTRVAMEVSYNLGVTPGGSRRWAGTRWHFNDAYKTVLDRGTAKLRFYPGTDDGTEFGKPVFWSEEVMAAKRKDMGPYTFASNILLNPVADYSQGFKREWLRHYKRLTNLNKMNGYILVDAASSKKKGSDYTSINVVLLNVDLNYYVGDMVRDRLNLAERIQRVFDLHRRWSDLGVNIKPVRYERYGMMADIEALRAKMEADNYRFSIEEVGGLTSKEDRIKRLVPIFEQGRMWLPESLYVTDWQKVPVDLVHVFIEEEYMAFPFGLHEDILDALARIAEPDLKLIWPKEEKVKSEQPVVRHHDMTTAWMA